MAAFANEEVGPNDWALVALLGSVDVELSLEIITGCGCRNVCGVTRWLIIAIETTHAVTIVQK